MGISFGTFTELGSTLGVPALLIVFWLYIQVKDLNGKVKSLERDNELLKDTLSDIRSDVSYIKGKLEGN